MSLLPTVVCRTATFGRRELLNEAVESFLRQDYEGPKEMHILNDCPGVEYWCDHPEIKIENTSDRFPTLGDKFNHLLRSFECDVVINWPDDDIMLPWAISTVISNLKDNDVFAGIGFWYMESGEIKKFDNKHCAGVLAFRHSVWKRIGGYASMNSGEDQEFFRRVAESYEIDFTILKPDNAYFIYRWQTGYGHLSAYDSIKDASRDGYSAYGKEVINRSIPGSYQILPNWHRDYMNLVKEYCQNSH